jgi:hypothetical protein
VSNLVLPQFVKVTFTYGKCFDGIDERGDIWAGGASWGRLRGLNIKEPRPHHINGLYWQAALDAWNKLNNKHPSEVF